MAGDLLAQMGRSAAARPLRRLMRPLLSYWAKPVPVPLSTGHICYVDMRSAIGRGLLVSGQIDPKLAEWIANALDGKEGVFIDIGANVGFFSLLALSKMRLGTVHSFEVDPRTLSCLKLTKANGKLDRLVIHECGLGESNSSAGLVAEKELGWTHVDFNATSGGRFTIRPLDDFAGDFVGQRVIAVKIDVEGMELAVLRGARNVLLDHKPLVVCEAIEGHLERYGGTVRQLVEFMESLGYTSRVLAGTEDPTLVFSPEPV